MNYEMMFNKTQKCVVDGITWWEYPLYGIDPLLQDDSVIFNHSMTVP